MTGDTDQADTRLGMPERYALVVSACATAAYALSAWYIAGLWSTLVSDSLNVSRFSAWTVRPLDLPAEYGMLHWQLVAVLSLLLHSYWGLRRTRVVGPSGFVLPLFCHLGWLLTAFLLQVCGLLISFVSVGYVI